MTNLNGVILTGSIFDELAETSSFGSGLKEPNNIHYMQPKFEIGREFLEKEYFEKNQSQQEIADKLGISQWVISQRMKEFNLKTKNRTWKLGARIYNIDDDFFDELNSTNAWVLGWLASDGFVVGKDTGLCFGIKVSAKDSDILYKIKKLLAFDGPVLKATTYLKKTGKNYQLRMFKASSKKIIKRLKEFGIVRNKTKKLAFPELIEKSNNEEIIRAFIQGFFEGDGSVLFDKKYNSPCFQIVGTKEMLEGTQTQLINYLGLKKTKLTKNTKLGNHFALRYRGRYQAVKIFDWLYSNPEHRLERKYRQYLEIKRRLS